MVQSKSKVKYRSIGAVEGRLESLSLHPGRRQFLVCHRITGKVVQCSLPPELEAAVKSGLGRRVIVSGMVAYGEKGHPLSVSSERLRVMPEDEELPSPGDMLGLVPDLTGDKSTAEYIGMLRDGE